MSESPSPEAKPATQLEEQKAARRVGFNSELRKFVTQMRETLEVHYSTAIEIGNVPQSLVMINRYMSVYNNTQPEEHYCYFENLYNRNRAAVLETLRNDAWIKEGKIVIQYGEGMKSMPPALRQVRIPISAVYQDACRLQTLAEAAMDGGEADGGKDMIRPDILILHLLRIFYHLNSGADRSRLEVLIGELEERLGMTKTLGAAAAAATTAPSTGGLSSVFSMATSMMEKMGIKPPEGMKAPSDAEISTVLAGVFNNAETQGAIQQMMTSMQNCNNFNEVVQTMVSHVTEPTTMTAIQESVMKSAQDAMATSGSPPTEAKAELPPPAPQ